jgi:hypothetical protein
MLIVVSAVRNLSKQARGVSHNVSSSRLTSDNKDGWVLNDGAEKCAVETRKQANLGRKFIFILD